MAGLSEEVQTIIVQALACYTRPSHIVEDVKAVFDVTVSRQQVQFYNPDRGGAGKRLAERWRRLFAETRRRFDADVSSLPVAKLSYRLARLQRMSERAEDSGQMALAADLLKQAAQDRGGLFTNRRRLEVTNPLDTLSDLIGVPPDELPEELREEKVH